MDKRTSEAPETVPSVVADLLSHLDEDTLRDTIKYAREVLNVRLEETTKINLSTGEELVSIEDRSGYTKAVKAEPCAVGCPDCPHGPYLYHVRREPKVDRTSTSMKWRYLGKVVE